MFLKYLLMKYGYKNCGSAQWNKINSNIYHSRSDFTEKIKGCSLSVSQHDKKKLHTLFYWILHIEWWILHMALGNSLLKHHFIISKKNIWETSCCKLYIYIFHKYSHLFLDLSATCIFYSSEIGSCIQYIYWSQSLVCSDMTQWP